MAIDFENVLAEHKKWIDSDGDEGRRADLRRANLRLADLQGANLRRANLRLADLQGANLRLADLQEADLYGADLQGAYLYGANMQGAYLYGANMQLANLYGANMYGADLQEADLRLADLRRADMQEANLRLADMQGANMDEMYSDIPVTLSEVRDVVLSHQDRLDMENWHGDDDWHNGKAKSVDECGTAHCIAGWAHHLAALRRPELLSNKVNVYLVGRLALGEEAAEHFYDSNEEALEWLESLDL